MKKYFIYAASLLLAAFVNVGCGISDDKNTEKLTKQMESALNNNDFVTAMAAARTLDGDEYIKENVIRVASAQAGFLIAGGDFDLARQIAEECNIPDKYYEKILPNLMTIAQKHGANQAIAAMMSCTLPVQLNPWGAVLIISNAEWNQFMSKHNKYIDRFMGYLQISGETEAIKKCAFFLDDNYEGGPKEVAQIKAKYGVK